MNAVGLDGSGDIDEILVEHGHEGDAALGREIAKDLVEGADVVRAIIGRQRDAGEKDFYVSVQERGEHLIEIRAGLGDGQAAEAVVAAELDNHDGRVKPQDIGQSRKRILGGGTAGALVDNFVPIALGVEHFLEEVRVSLALLKTQTSGDAVAEADEDGAIRIWRRGGGKRAGGQQEGTTCDENYAASIHVSSVASRMD